MRKLLLVTTLLTAAPAMAATTASPASAETKRSTTRNFNFKNAEIETVAAEISKRLGKTFVIDPVVRGKITIEGPGIQSDEDAYHAFLIGLAINGFTVIDEGKFTRILQAQNAQRNNIPVSYDAPETTEEKMITVIFRLKNTDARELYNQLGPILQSRLGEMRVMEEKNMIILSDYTSNVNRVKKIIDAAESQANVKAPPKNPKG